MDLEALRVRGHHLQHRSRQVHVGAVLREIGGEGQDLVPRLRHQAEGVGQRPGRAGVQRHLHRPVGEHPVPGGAGPLGLGGQPVDVGHLHPAASVPDLPGPLAAPLEGEPARGQIQAGQLPLAVPGGPQAAPVVVRGGPPEIGHGHALEQLPAPVPVGGHPAPLLGEEDLEVLPPHPQVGRAVHHLRRPVRVGRRGPPAAPPLAEGHLVALFRPALVPAQPEGDGYRILPVQPLRPQGQGVAPALPRRDVRVHGPLRQQHPLPAEPDGAREAAAAGEEVAVGDLRPPLADADGQILVEVLHLLALGGGGPVEAVHQAVAAEIAVVGPVVEVAAVAQPGPAVPVLSDQGLVDIVPDKPALVGRHLLRQADIPLLVAEGAAHGVAVLAGDGGAGAVPGQRLPDALRRPVHIAEDVAGVLELRGVDHALVVDRPVVRLPEVLCRPAQVLPAPGLVAAGPDKHAGVVPVPAEHGLRPGQHRLPPLGVAAGDVARRVQPPHLHHLPGPVGLQVHLVEDVDPVPVAQAVEGALVGVVAGAHGVDVHPLHGEHVPEHLLLGDAPPPPGGELVAVHPPQQDAPAVELHDSLPDLKPPQAHLLIDGLRQRPRLVKHLDLQAVEPGVLGAPQPGMLHRQRRLPAQGGLRLDGQLPAAVQPAPDPAPAQRLGGHPDLPPAQVPAQGGGDPHIPDMRRRDGVQIHLPEQPRQPEEILVLHPAGAGVLEHLDRQLVLPRP